MIPKDCKRLAEVDFPIADVSRHAVAENKIRQRHPKTLHLWWARRPLASSRAVLLGLLWPDPCDPLCPSEFKDQARKLLRQVAGCNPGTTDENLRRALLRFIADFANWDLASNRTYLDVSRALVKAAHGEEPPLVVDPFAGGGSIPLEALRVGCDSFASDLNPVACLILKTMLEDIQRHGSKLAEEVRRVGAAVKEQAERELAELYPKDPDGATPIAYLWARTVRCESPNCGAEIPLIRSFWLCKKASRRQALRYQIDRHAGATPTIIFDIFGPKTEGEVPCSTVVNGKATCVCCNAVLPPDRVRGQLTEQRGGATVAFDASKRRVAGARMLAVVTVMPSETGRRYRLPTERDYQAVFAAQMLASKAVKTWERAGKQGLCPIPNEIMNPVRPSPNARGLSAVTRYGMTVFGDLFTARQQFALIRLASSVAKLKEISVQTALALTVSKISDYGNSLCRWRATSECADALFGRKAIPMVYDFAEPCPMAGAAGSWDSLLDRSTGGLQSANIGRSGTVELSDATNLPLPDDCSSVWFTDPPYYDSIPYADLADFFLVWLKRALPGSIFLHDPFDAENPLSPKAQECVWNKAYYWNGRPKDKKFFEETMARAFSEGRRVLNPDGIASVVFAHKTTEGWEALLSGAVHGGWTVTGSWPIATEMGARLAARDTAALATSVHLICRPRPHEAPIGDWADVLRELPERVGDWMEHLQSEGVRGADLVFACIGPALEIFSRYSRVETAEGQEVALAEYLEKVWEIVGRTALRQVLGSDTPTDFGEDARLTALFLWTLQAANGYAAAEHVDYDEKEVGSVPDENVDGDVRSVRQHNSKGYALPFDIVRRIAQPLGIRLDRWNRRLIVIEKGIVRLLPLPDRAAFLVEPGIAHDLKLVDIHGRRKSEKQLDLFEKAPDTGRQAKEVTASARVERGTWSQLHLDSISTLDHVHKAMLFQRQGATNALRELLFYEKHYRPEFVRLANALSALYPKGSDEKRLLDAMLLAIPR